MKRQQYSKEFKARVAIDALKGQRPLAELCAEYGVHNNQTTGHRRRCISSIPVP